ncbi:MAG: FAD-binding protein, partial [Myxococcota bacterium]
MSMFADHLGFFSRRRFLGTLGRLAAFSTAGSAMLGSGWLGGCGRATGGDPPTSAWPSKADWDALRKQVHGRLIHVKAPLDACTLDAGSAECTASLEQMNNPFYLEDHAGATQTTGWLDAWTARVSPYAVAAETPEDIVAAVNFAREHRVRLVIKGTGHDYLGRSNAPDSLLVWTHEMRGVTVHDSFTPAGSPGPGGPAVTVEAGTRWLEAYAAVTGRHGRYVQGGGCTSVGAAGGFMLGGGFGALSKRYGSAAGSMLEAEIVTADGKRLVANEFQNADLFWALRGGGGGTFGVVTRLTLQTHPMPRTIGGLNGSIEATSDEAFRELLARFMRFYPGNLNNQNWGETDKVTPGNQLKLSLAFIDLSEAQARSVWEPFRAWIDARPNDFHQSLDFLVLPFRELWNLDFWLERSPGMVEPDPREGQPPGQFWWASNQKAVSEYIYDYKSRWLPLRLFDDPEQLAQTLFAASRHWEFSLYVNKGMAGIPEDALRRDRNTSINPAVFDAAAWVLMMASETNAFPGVPGREPDPHKAREIARRVSAGMKIIRDATPNAGTYSNEADYHEPNWQEAFWGSHYSRLLAIKQKYDP